MVKFKFNIAKLLCLGFAASIFVSSAFANEDDDEVLRESAKIAVSEAAKHYGQKIGQAAVGKIVTKTLGESAAQTGAKTLGRAVSVYQFVSSVKELSEAKSDKAKFFAASDATLAAYAVAYPPGSTIAVAVIVVAKLVDASISQMYAEKAGKLLAEIARLQAETTELQTAQAVADMRLARSWSDGLLTELNAYENSVTNTQKACDGLETKSPSFEEMKDCLEAYRPVLAHFENFLSYANRLDSYSSRFIDIAGFQPEERTRFKSTKEWLDHARDKFEENRKILDAYRDFASELLGSSLVNQAMQLGETDMVEQSREACFEAARDFNTTAALAILQSTLLDDGSMPPLALNKLRSDELSSFDDTCEQFILTENDHLGQMLSLRKRNLRQLEVRIRELNNFSWSS